MRFNDGFWILKDGVKAHYALQATKVSEQASGYELLVSTKPIRHRGDTLEGRSSTALVIVMLTSA